MVRLGCLRLGGEGSAGLGFGSAWVLWLVSILLSWCGRDSVVGVIYVLGLSSCPSTVKKPPNCTSSGSAFPSKLNTPISTVASLLGSLIVSIQPSLLDPALDSSAVRTTLLEIVS